MEFKLLGEEIELKEGGNISYYGEFKKSREYFETLDLHKIYLRNDIQEKYFQEYLKKFPQFKENKGQNASLLREYDHCEEFGVAQKIYLCPLTWLPPFFQFIQAEREKYLQW
ncbi:MAG: hypothetical protein RBG13Loki_2820 [Promethearchaeota archaeon CR_4]|nr:MAG: hypothetical protein RBG13Loki_2820 [Candidatus Lokiarchaeota archaeon CR_4]